MNYLAHAYLSCGDPGLLMGNLITDFIPKKEEILFTEEIQKGIRLHRFIDQFMDNDEIVKQGTKRLFPSQGKYASVVIDILYDYLLSKFWNNYDDRSLREFADDMYSLLMLSIPDLPSDLQLRLTAMIKRDFLMLYSSENGVLKSLNYMDTRTKFKSSFNKALDDYMAFANDYDREFNEFFPIIIKEVGQFCDCT